MYRIEQAAEDQWTIVDEDDEVVFTSTLRGCEDWLDFQENAERLASRSGWWSRFIRRITGLFSLGGESPGPRNGGEVPPHSRSDS